MESNDLLSKLMNALNTLPDSDLRRLAAMFRQPEVWEAWVQLIEGSLALRKAERSVNSQKSRANEVRPERRTVERNSLHGQGDQIDTQSVQSMEDTLVALLNDRNLFTSTKEVVNIVNKGFGCEIDYQDFRKRGRRDLIRRCLRHLSNFSNQKKIHLIRSFFQDVSEKTEKMDQYPELFRILSGYE